MTGLNDDNQQSILDQAVQQFIDALLQGQKPDIDEFVKQYPGLEQQIKEKIRNLQKIDTLFDSLVQADESDFEDTASGEELVGRKVGSFEIVEMIGRGGMGVVYLAHDTKLDRSVAVKSMPAELQASSSAQARFKREAKLLASLNHPNIAAIHDIIEQDESAGYLILEYVPGETLAQRIAREPLNLEQALSIGRQVAEAVSAAHENGVIHRDLKPGNIKITPEGKVKVLDFGLAKASAREGKSADPTVTQPGRVMGTPAYMSPEQACGKPTDKRSDIWSFGCIMYQMLAGHIPFEGDTATEILARIIERQPDWEGLPAEVGPAMRDIISKCLQKDPERRYRSAAELHQDLVDYQATLTAPSPKALDLKTLLLSLRKPRIAIGSLIVVSVLCVAILWLINRSAKVQWARLEVLPEIESLIEQDKYLAAFSLARQAEKYIPKDPMLKELWPDMSRDYSVITTPAGADIFFKEYSDIDSQWQYLGQSPLENIRFPCGAYRCMVKKEGFEIRESIADVHLRDPNKLTLEVVLQEKGSNPGMVLIPSQTLEAHLGLVSNVERIQAPAYLIDKYEVTNQQFKEFVDKGGYQRRDYWKHKFIKDGHELSWDEAMREFRDKIGRPGPSTWEGGTYPKGQEKYPVSGVSWYEAAAYSEFAGKSLPTVYHWSTAVRPFEAPIVIPFSNFSSKGPAPVGNHKGIGLTGLYDTAGNVKEWCFNATDDSGDHRYILGAAWGEQIYQFGNADSRPRWDRAAANGFRCVRYPGGQDSVSDSLFRPVARLPFRDYSKEKPVSDEEFQFYKKLYAYDRIELNAVVESVDDSSRHWRKEKITFDAAYGGERVIAYLFIPKGIRPPYQPIVYFPGSNAIRQSSSEGLLEDFGTFCSLFIDFVIKSGRAVLYPVYKGTYERQIDREDSGPGSRPIAYRDWVIQFSKDFRRSIDYLETREDIDNEKIAYYGMSWGARVGPIMLAVEERIKLGILVAGGFGNGQYPPATDPLNFAPRVKVPVLMINGEHDFSFPVETSLKPMFEFLGTPEEDKAHILYPGGHGLMTIFSRQVKGDVLGWLDRYLGPVD
jgi:serine/threonine protein kinase/formylglycine-generating enzyme required for sulfatase activity/dienelactone hydrolase